MAKLTRVTGKVFGATASTTNTPVEIGQFGSAKAGTYNATNDVATIQNLSAWSNGWIDAVTPTDQFPPLPEMTGVHKVLSYQNAYVLQEGMPEYDANTTYYENSICKGVNNEGNLVFYKSLVDNNTGNALSDNNYWEELSFGGGSRNIGEIVASTMPLTDAGLHLLDGSQLQYGSYKAFIDYIADLYDSGNYSAIFDTEANWQSAVTTYGVCGKFVYDSVNNTVRLPKYGSQMFTVNNISTATTLPVKGDGKSLGLTDASNNLGIYASSGTSGLRAVTGAYNKNAGASISSEGTQSTGKALGVTTDGTKSGIIADLPALTNTYGVNCYYYIVIATTTKTSIEVDIDEIATDLNGKADVELTNLSSTQSANFDGQWISSSITLAEDASCPSSAVVYFDLSNYLPSDNYKYEVLCYATAVTGSTSGNYARISIKTDLISDYTTICNVITRSSSTQYTSGACIFPIGTGRKITVGNWLANTGTYSLYIRAYRRIGTNQ